LETEVEEQRFGLEKHLQDFLWDNWEETEVLGPEWKLFEDETGPNAGYEYQTAVGQIDLLVEHKTEDRWLVVELKRE
jgi:restriction system protein